MDIGSITTWRELVPPGLRFGEGLDLRAPFGFDGGDLNAGAPNSTRMDTRQDSMRCSSVLRIEGLNAEYVLSKLNGYRRRGAGVGGGRESDGSV